MSVLFLEKHMYIYIQTEENINFIAHTYCINIYAYIYAYKYIYICNDAFSTFNILHVIKVYHKYAIVFV